MAKLIPIGLVCGLGLCAPGVGVGLGGRGDGEGDGDGDGLAAGDVVGFGDGDGDGDAAGEGLGDGDGDGLGEGNGEGLGDGLGDGLGVGGNGEGLGVGKGLGDGVGVCIATLTAVTCVTTPEAIVNGILIGLSTNPVGATVSRRKYCPGSKSLVASPKVSVVTVATTESSVALIIWNVAPGSKAFVPWATFVTTSRPFGGGIGEGDGPGAATFTTVRVATLLGVMVKGNRVGFSTNPGGAAISRKKYCPGGRLWEASPFASVVICPTTESSVPRLISNVAPGSKAFVPCAIFVTNTCPLLTGGGVGDGVGAGVGVGVAVSATFITLLIVCEPDVIVNGILTGLRTKPVGACISRIKYSPGGKCLLASPKLSVVTV